MPGSPYPTPVIMHPITKAMVPGVSVPVTCNNGCHAGKVAIVPRLGCDHRHTMCEVCADRWHEIMTFLITDQDPEFDRAIAMLERVC